VCPLVTLVNAADQFRRTHLTVSKTAQNVWTFENMNHTQWCIDNDNFGQNMGGLHIPHSNGVNTGEHTHTPAHKLPAVKEVACLSV
jgi:hypothetical protein